VASAPENEWICLTQPTPGIPTRHYWPNAFTVRYASRPALSPPGVYYRRPAAAPGAALGRRARRLNEPRLVFDQSGRLLDETHPMGDILIPVMTLLAIIGAVVVLGALVRVIVGWLDAGRGDWTLTPICGPQSGRGC
jgi:hypothetical protein